MCQLDIYESRVEHAPLQQKSAPPHGLPSVAFVHPVAEVPGTQLWHGPFGVPGE